MLIENILSEGDNSLDVHSYVRHMFFFISSSNSTCISEVYLLNATLHFVLIFGMLILWKAYAITPLS
jgi:hypothetical protein